MIEIDGTFGEGGGQILRTSLALSALTGQPFRIARIRGRRAKPGLHRQHLTSVLAAQQIAEAEVRGAELGSHELTFIPRRLAGGEFRFDIQTAGSAMLVLQTVLPPLFHAEHPAVVTVRGGTHNPMSPPFDHFAETFAPAIARMGFRVRARLIGHGFFPAGGGEVVAEIEPARAPAPTDFVPPTGPVVLSARVLLARLPDRVWENEKRALESLGLEFAAIERRNITDSAGPGNCVEIVVDRGQGEQRSRSVLTAFGERGRPSAAVVAEVAGYARDLIAHPEAAVDRFQADQLLVYLAMAGGGSLTTSTLSLHATTNTAVIERFMPVRFETQEENGVWRVRCEKRAGES